MAVPAQQRLRTQSDFQQVRNQGTRVTCGLFIVQFLRHDQQKCSESAPRLGVIASRRVGNAVKRNYGKRLIRTLFRTHQAKLASNVDLVVILRSNFDSVPFADLEVKFLKACASISAQPTA
jgi:ribonuclease P protein component